MGDLGGCLSECQAPHKSMESAPPTVKQWGWETVRDLEGGGVGGLGSEETWGYEDHVAWLGVESMLKNLTDFIVHEVKDRQRERQRE